MSDPFYRAFEEKFRGGRAEIKQRLQVYVPFLTELAQAYPHTSVVDLGCGRGEWLELLREHGLTACGVDLDQSMLEACHEQGLVVETADAIEFLSRQSDSSALAVTAFHLVEHIEFSALRELVAQSFRILKPGGLLIMETPNPENLMVATQGFYLDPTHEKPIPPDLLAFVPEYAGFTQIKILRLQESPAILENVNLSLNDVLGGASPDYAVVAQKPAASDVLGLVQKAYQRVYGISSAALAERYRHQNAERNQQNLHQVEWIRHQTLKLQRQQHAMTLQMMTLHQQSMALHQQSQEHLQQLQVQINETKAEAAQWAHQLVLVYASRSWAITRPLRWLSLQRRRLSEQGFVLRFKAVLKKIARPIWAHLQSFLNLHPRCKLFVIRCSQRLGLYERIHRWHYRQPAQSVLAHPVSAIKIEQLTPHARQLHDVLQKHLSQKKG
jgi:O-antigen chain-terminating methyltransferase